MVKSANRDKLLEALSRIKARSPGDGGRLTLAEVAREAGVSRATANRDVAFVAALKHAVSEAAAATATKARQGAPARRRLVRDLRRTIDDMANVIQALSLAYDKLEQELTRLRGERGGPTVVPLLRSNRKHGTTSP